MLRKNVLQEERTRSTQLSAVQDSVSTLQHDMEEELREIKQSFDAKFRDRRQGDDDICRRLSEFSALASQEEAKRGVFENTLRNQITAWQQDLMTEKEEASTLIRRSTQNLEAAMKEELTNLKDNLESEISKHAHNCEWLDKRVSDVCEGHAKEQRDRAAGDDEVMRLAMQARHMVERELQTRQGSDTQLRQNMGEISTTLDQQSVIQEQNEKQLQDMASRIETLRAAQAEHIEEKNERKKHEDETLEEFKNQLQGLQQFVQQNQENQVQDLQMIESAIQDLQSAQKKS